MKFFDLSFGHFLLIIFFLLPKEAKSVGLVLRYSVRPFLIKL